MDIVKEEYFVIRRSGKRLRKRRRYRFLVDFETEPLNFGREAAARPLSPAAPFSPTLPQKSPLESFFNLTLRHKFLDSAFNIKFHP